MTGQELKGRVTFWVLAALVAVAVLTGNFREAGVLLGLLVGGVILYQVVGHAYRLVSLGKWDPFNVGPRRDPELELWRNGDKRLAEDHTKQRQAQVAATPPPSVAAATTPIANGSRTVAVDDRSGETYSREDWKREEAERAERRRANRERKS